MLDKAPPRALDNKAFIEAYTRLCFSKFEDNRIIRAAEKYLDAPEISSDVKTKLSTACAEACFLRGDFEKASAVLEKYHLSSTTLPGFLLRAQILWENGEHESA